MQVARLRSIGVEALCPAKEALEEGANDAPERDRGALKGRPGKREKTRERLSAFLQSWNQGRRDAADEPAAPRPGEPVPDAAPVATPGEAVNRETAKAHVAQLAAQAENHASTNARQAPLQAARSRYGRPFAHEAGSDFQWTSGPTVLNRWLAQRALAKSGTTRRK